MQYLEIPKQVLNRADARELVRFWVCEGQCFVALQTDLFGEKEPEVWGTVASDIVKHAVIALGRTGDNREPAALRARIVRAFERAMDTPAGEREEPES